MPRATPAARDHREKREALHPKPTSAHPRLPRSLPKRLKRAGFRLDGTDVFPILNLEWADNTYSKGMTTFIRDFVSRRNDVPLEDVEEWTNEFQILNEAGEYFFSSNRYIFKAAKPDP